jgi:hypothetical protein
MAVAGASRGHHVIGVTTEDAMLSSDDRNAIESLFRRLEEAERQGGPRDRDAEELIERLVRRQPAAPYYLAQTVAVQQEALNRAEQRIEELEARVDRNPDPRRRNPWGDPAPAPYAPPPAYGYGGFGSGGFLAGAAPTALGVAGGVLLGNMIGSIFSSGSAHAAETVTDTTSDDTTPTDAVSTDPGAGDAGSFGDGADFDGGGFDTGGDF